MRVKSFSSPLRRADAPHPATRARCQSAMLMAGASLQEERCVRPVNVTPSSTALQPSCDHVHVHKWPAEAWAVWGAQGGEATTAMSPYAYM
jgi:hypothetical protein